MGALSQMGISMPPPPSGPPPDASGSSTSDSSSSSTSSTSSTGSTSSTENPGQALGKLMHDLFDGREVGIRFKRQLVFILLHVFDNGIGLLKLCEQTRESDFGVGEHFLSSSASSTSSTSSTDSSLDTLKSDFSNLVSAIQNASGNSSSSSTSSSSSSTTGTSSTSSTWRLSLKTSLPTSALPQPYPQAGT